MRSRTIDEGDTPGLEPRREQMLRAAARIIGERGYGDTRIADVAQASGASPALVIYYFGTRENLLTAALRYSEDLFYADSARALAEIGSAGERLERLVQLTFDGGEVTEEPSSWTLWFDLWAQAFRNPEVGKDRAEFDQRWRDTIAEIVRAGQESGEFGPVDAAEFAIVFAALLDGLSIQVVLGDPVVTRDRAIAVAIAYASDRLRPP